MGTISALISMSKEWKEWVDSDYPEEKEPYKDARMFLYELSEIASQLMWDEKIEKIINDQIHTWSKMRKSFCTN